MQPLDMKGPFWLNGATIDAAVAEGRPGNFALGELNSDGSFAVCHIGSSDTDLNGTLKSLVSSTKRRVFKFSYAESALSALERECRIYHDLSPVDNAIHPFPAAGVFVCPVCLEKLGSGMI
jgi:hypothetical protein